MPVTMVTVTGGPGGWITPAGAVATGRVTFQPVQSVTGGGYILAAGAVTATLVAGNISVSLANNSQIPGLQYLVTEQIADAISPAPYVLTPVGASLDLSSAPRGAIGPANPLYLLASSVGQPNGIPALDATGKVPAAQLPAASGGALVIQYIHTQATPATVWTVQHNLNRRPSAVSLFSLDYATQWDEYGVLHLDANSLRITADVALPGVALVE